MSHIDRLLALAEANKNPGDDLASHVVAETDDSTEGRLERLESRLASLSAQVNLLSREQAHLIDKVKTLFHPSQW